MIIFDPFKEHWLRWQYQFYIDKELKCIVLFVMSYDKNIEYTLHFWTGAVTYKTNLKRKEVQIKEHPIYDEQSFCLFDCRNIVTKFYAKNRTLINNEEIYNKLTTIYNIEQLEFKLTEAIHYYHTSVYWYMKNKKRLNQMKKLIKEVLFDFRDDFENDFI